MKNLEPKCFVGPMSKNVVDACIEFSNETDTALGLIPSRRQIDHKSGYVNGWTTDTFAEYVRQRTQNILIERDHGGPHQGDFIDSGKTSIDVDSSYFDMIHIDPFKKYKDIELSAIYTIDVINSLESMNCLFEIGTEESLFHMTSTDCRKFLDMVLSGVGEKNFDRVEYFVVQFGTKLLGNKNTGIFDLNKAKQMIEVCSDYGKKSKEHNGDYLSKEDVIKRRDLGLDAINIAPEMGGIESKCIIQEIGKDIKLYEKFVACCKSSNRWKKWFPVDYEPDTDILLESCGHYCFSTPEFDYLKDNIDYTLVKNNTKAIIKRRLEELL
jgi:hypothetical protein